MATIIVGQNSGAAGRGLFEYIIHTYICIYLYTYMYMLYGLTDVLVRKKVALKNHK